MEEDDEQFMKRKVKEIETLGKADISGDSRYFQHGFGFLGQYKTENGWKTQILQYFKLPCVETIPEAREFR